MLLNKQKFKLLNIAIITFAALLLIFSNNAGAAVDAKTACKPVESATKKIKDACTAYINAYNKCKASNTKCKIDAYNAYVKTVCGTGSTAVRCADDRTKVIAARTTSSGAGVVECASGGEVKNNCTCPAGEIVQTVDGVSKCVKTSTGGGGASSGAGSINTNPNLSNDSAIEGAPSEQETYNYFEDPNCSGDECLKNNPIVKWLNVLINIVAGIIGIGAVVMIIFSGIQYITARDNPQAIQSAKQKIVNVVIGLVAFGLLYAFLNWLVPGGVLG